MTGGDETSSASLGAQFLGTFNEIEGHLRDSLQCGDHVPFGDMVRTYADQHRLPREHVKALNVFASLRNAISHQNYYGGRPIAEPVAEVVDQIVQLKDQILRPPMALTCLGRREVSVTAPDSPISAVLEVVRRYDYSQVPVYGGDGYTGLLTTNCIARWLADRLERVTLADDEPVEAVMAFAEAHDVARHIRRTTTAAVAIDLLSQPTNKGVRLAALIITDAGRASEKPLAVVVDADLPVLMAALSLSRRDV